MKAPAPVRLDPGGVRPGVPWDILAVALLATGALLLATLAHGGIAGRFLPYDDDLFYAAAARMLAEGHGYGIPRAGDLPLIPRFPPGWPALLALAWPLARSPAEAVAAWEMLASLTMAAFLLISYAALTRLWGISRPAAGAAVALAAVHRMTQEIGSAMFSDFPGALAALIGLALASRAGRSGGAPLRHLLPAGLVLGGALLLRYAAIAAVVAAVAWLLLAGRRRAAAVLGALAASPVVLWGLWTVVAPRSGYWADLQANLRGASPAGAIGSGLHWLLAAALPGLVLPGPFLTGGLGSPLALPPAWLLPAGLLIGGALVAALVAACRTPERRLPALWALATVALAGVWSGGFRQFAWWLEVRLLLPVLPVVLALSIETAGRLAARGGAVLRPTLALAGLATAILAVPAGLQAGTALRDAAREARAAQGPLVAALAFLDRLPAGAAVGAIYPLQVFFYTGRVPFPVPPSETGMDRARGRGVRVLLAQPWSHDGKDLTFVAVRALQARRPPAARVLYVASDRLAAVELLRSSRFDARPVHN